MTFRIQSLEKDRIKYPLSIENEDNNNIFTLIVGKNGVGKSRLMTSIIHHYCKKKSESYYQHYYYDKIDVIKNIKSTSNPTIIIAQTNSQFDKFPAQYIYNHNKLYYKFNSRGEYIIYDLFNSIIFNENNEDHTSIINVLKYLTYSQKVELNYVFKSGTTSPHYLDTIVNLYIDYIPNTDINLKLATSKLPQPIKKFLNILQYIKESKFDKIPLEDFMVLYDLYKVDKIYQYVIKVDYDLKIKHIDFNILNENHINILKKYKILHMHDLIFYKKDNNERVSFNSLSSGEKSIIYTLLNISRYIVNNSLVCIDEPEISLHPEWQEEIISKIQEAFAFTTGCHFLIATHSPQVVSGLKSKNGYILDLESKILHRSREYTNKSADHQLAKIFNAPGHNNEYLIRIALVIISKLAKQETLDEKDLENLRFLRNIKESLPSGDSVQFLIEQLISMESI